MFSAPPARASSLRSAAGCRYFLGAHCKQRPAWEPGTGLVDLALQTATSQKAAVCISGPARSFCSHLLFRPARSDAASARGQERFDISAQINVAIAGGEEGYEGPVAAPNMHTVRWTPKLAWACAGRVELRVQFLPCHRAAHHAFSPRKKQVVTLFLVAPRKPRSEHSTDLNDQRQSPCSPPGQRVGCALFIRGAPGRFFSFLYYPRGRLLCCLWRRQSLAPLARSVYAVHRLCSPLSLSGVRALRHF